MVHSDTIGRLSPPASRYARAVVSQLQQVLGRGLVGAYVYGSGAMGDFFPARSDVDLVAVADAALGADEAMTAAQAVAAIRTPHPIKGLDLTVVTLDSAVSRRPAPTFELKLLTFFGEVQLGEPDGPGDARLLMHFACCYDHGVAVVGPGPRHVFEPVARALYLRALRQELDIPWMAHHYRVLNACRDWRFLEEGTICSKVAGGRWALPRVADRWLIEAALLWQTAGSGPVMDSLLVDDFVASVARTLDEESA